MITQDLGWEVLNKERLMIEKALRDSRGRLKPAAEILGVSRQVLSYKLKKLGIDRLAYR
jgi:Response regulator containing CheY-like receiver, AAA-type ATPase, and DNA-binding domains